MDLELFQQKVADELERKKQAQERPSPPVAEATLPGASAAAGIPARPNLANFAEKVSGALDNKLQESRAYLAGTLRENRFAPEQASKALDLSRKTNTPLFLFDSPEAIQQAEQNARVQETLDRVSRAPLTGELFGSDTWLTRAMSDSVDRVAEVEEVFKNSGFAEAARRQKMLEDRDAWEEFRERERAAKAPQDSGTWAGLGRAVVSGATEGVAISGRGYADLRRMLTRLPGAGLFLTAEDVVASGLTGQTLADTASESAKALQDAARELRGANEGYIYDVAAALGQLIPQVVFYATSPAAGTTNLFAQGVGIMSEKIEGDDADPTTMDAARLLGGATTAITSRLPMEALLGRMSPQLKSELATALARIGIAAGAEGAQEIVEDLVMDTIRILLTNPEAEFELRETLYEGAVGAGAGGIFRALLEAALGIKRRGGRDQAEADGEQLQQIFDIISDTPARERSPETFGQLISQITEAATVYVTPQALQEAAAQTGVELPSATVDQINEAIEGMGSGVEVKLGDLATAYAGTPVERLLLDNTRRTPEGLTLAEVRAEQENALNQFAEEAERIIARQTERQAFAESADRVRDSFKAAVEVTGKYRPQQVDSFSRLMRAYYATMASRLGITPEQLRDGWVDANGVQRRGYMPSFVAPDTAPTDTFAFNQQATPELFTRANIGRIMEARDWAVITAENPNAQALSPEENAARNEQLKADLDAMGIQYIGGSIGRYGNLENPLILLGVSPAQAQELTKRYEQEAALFPGGYLYQDGTVSPARGVNIFDTAPEDYYTTLPDGTMFSMDIDFNQRVPLAETEYAQRLEGLAGDVPQQPMADREALRVEREFDAWIDADPEAAVDAYLEAFGSEINTDLARELSPEYRADLTRWSVAVHEPASRLAKLAYARLLETLPNGSTIVFSGGGGGSGKGYALGKTGIKARADAVYDLTMGNYDSTKAKIEQALAAGMKVQIAFVRTPFEVAISRAVERTKIENGRVVAITAFAEAHVGAPQTFNEFLTDYAGNTNVEITLIDNTETPTVVESATLESPDYNQIVERFQDEINRQLESGEISQEIADAYLVGSDGQVLAGQPGRDTGAVLRAQGQSVGRSGGEDSLGQSVSTRVWSQKGGRQDPHMLTGLDVDYKLVENRPKFQQALATAMKGLAQLRITARKPEAVLEQAITQMQDNLRWLFNQVPPEVRARSRKWYEGGRVIVDRWTAKYDGAYTDAQLAGVLAVMSPQLAWDANVTLAERIVDIYTGQQNTNWSPEMETKAGEILKSGASKQLHDAVRGKTLAELSDPLEAAVWVRVYDETVNPRSYRQVTPEGGWGDWMRTAKGAETKAGWQNGHGPIANAIAILRDGSIPNISRSLGSEHKVRNFYNNLFDPQDGSSVTIDTHAVAAALLSPLSGSSPEVLANFGAPSDAPTGMSGTYVVYAEAYRRLAAEVGMLPREVQSITWEAVRRMYSAPFKSQFVKQPALQKKFAEVWKGYTSGKETIDGTREQLVALTGNSRIPDPGWIGQNTGLDAGAPDSSYTGSVLESGWARGAADTGSGGAAPAADQAFGQSAARLTRPPVNADGTVTLWHYGKVPNVSELDPAMSGTGIAGQDIKRRDADPDNWVNRTYYGIAIGQPGGYKREPGLGVNLYRVEIPTEQMYDMAADPDGLRPARAELSGWDNQTSVFERRIKEAGYKGYWVNSQQLGLTAAVFEKMPARQVPREEAPDGAFGQSRRQTQTPAFRRWFGDSKVVDANGEPLVVYHGTTADFSAFDPERVGERFGLDQDGFFFTGNTITASGFADPQSQFLAAGMSDPAALGSAPRSGANVIPAYLSLQNPLTLDEYTYAFDTTPKREIDDEGLSLIDYFDDNRRSIVAYAKEGGNDGVLFQRNGQTFAVAFRPEQVKSAIGNVGDFDPANPDITRQDRRGEFAPQTMEIRLLADADASTFIHESAHFMLTMMTDLALDPNAPADVRADVEAFLKQIGFEGTVEEWAAKPINEQREAHETFAESFEQYIFTGKAPTKELRGLFRRLADFMKRVYRDLRSFLAGPGQRAKLNPDLSRLFDRLLATEAEIEGASRERAYEAFFASAAEAGMTPEQFAEYIALDPEHRAQAEEALRALMLRDLKGEAAERRAEVKAEVEAELSQQPVYRAMLWLRRGKFFENGELVETPAGMSTNKLSIPVLKEMFPNVTDWAKLGYGKYGMLANEGLHPDLVAPLLGFESGDAMVKALLDAPSLSEAVETRTNEVMFERYNDLASPENMARAVDEAMHNDAGLERLAAEISTLYGRVGSKSRLLTAARQYAKAIVERKTSRTLRPADFSAAELRAGKAAIEALRRGDRAETLKQKRIELLNHAAAMEAHKASRDMDKMVQRMRSIARKGDDTSAVKSRDGDMVAATRALLSAYGLGTPRVQQAAGEYLKRLKEYDPGKADFLEAELTGAFANAKDWRTLTVGEMRELNSLVSDLWTDARESRTITVNGEKVEIDAAAEALVERMSKKPDFDKTRGTTEALTWKDKLAIQFGSIKGRFNRVLPWTGMMDRGRDGPWRQYLWRALVEPSDAFRARRVEVVTKQYGALVEKYKHLFKNETKIDGREIGYTFTGNAELVAALLHTGNESNLRKLLLGGRPDSPWGDVAQDGKTLDRTRWDRMVERLTSEGKITKDHWDFVQGVWDILESIKPEAQRAHRSLFGRFFNEITASPVQTPFGEYRGGYFPAVTDPSLVKSDTLRRQLQNENQTFSYAMPDKGFTKERVEYNRPLMLDMRVVSSHIDKVLMFSYLAKPVSDVRRLMMRENVSTNLERVQPGAMENMILPYLDRIANQKIETPSETGTQFDAIVRAGRRNTAMTYMFANLTNTLLQFTGAPLSMLKVPTGALLRAQADIVMHPKDSYEFIKSKSPFMAERLTNSNALMYDNMQEILTNPSVYEKAQNWAARNAYITQIWADRAISTTVWLGAYNHAFDNAPADMTEAGKERYARQQADDAVRQTQMDQSPEGIAAFEAGTPFQRLFTQFMGYFNMWATVIAEEGRVAQFKGDWMRLGFVGVVGLMIVPALGEVIRLVLAGGPEDDEGDGYLDDWLRSIGWGMLKFYGAAVPYAGPLAVGAIAPVMDDPFAARALTPPVAGAVESVGRAVKATAKMAEGEDVKPSQMIRAMANTINLFTGLPTGGLARPVGYAADVEAGYIVPTDRTDYIRGILTGIASPESK